MKNLAIIPARGGSKRIPRKNIKDFLGKPIISYSIKAALNSKLFEEVMVSTDDEEIATVAAQYGANIPFMRSKETAGDFATLSNVIEEVVDRYSHENHQFDAVCLILPTAPFVTSDLLKETYNILFQRKALYVHPIVKFSFPVQRGLRLSENGKICFTNPEFRRERSQDLEPIYHDAGMFYWVRPDTIFKTDERYGVEISEALCQDIDTKVDWALAEAKYRLFMNE